MAVAVTLQAGVIPEFEIGGIPAVGAKLFTYAAGTTNKQATYTDSTGATPQTNPIILNARGEPTNGAGSAGLWLQQSVAYKFVLAPSTDTDPPTNPIWTIDNVLTPSSTGISYSATGTNAIVLTPLSGTPTISAYANYQQFVFLAPATTTSSVTLQVGSLSALPVYIYGQQAASGSLTVNQLVVCYYVSSLGGFVALPIYPANILLTGTDTGAANAYAIAPVPPIAAYAAGQVAVFVAANANTSASTLNVNGLGTKAIKTTALVALGANQILAGAVCTCVYDGTQWQLTDAQPAQSSANSIRGNNTGSAANDIDMTVSQTLTLLGLLSAGTATKGSLTCPTPAGNIIINWGVVSSVPATSSGSDTLQTSYATGGVGIAVGDNTGTNGVGVTSVTTTTINVHNNTGTSVDISYITIGK